MNDRLLKRMILEAIQETIGEGEEEDESEFGKEEPASGGKRGFALKANKCKADDALCKIVQVLDQEFKPGMFKETTHGMMGIYYAGGRKSGNRRQVFIRPTIENGEFRMSVSDEKTRKVCRNVDDVVSTLRKYVGKGED